MSAVAPIVHRMEQAASLKDTPVNGRASRRRSMPSRARGSATSVAGGLPVTTPSPGFTLFS